MNIKLLLNSLLIGGIFGSLCHSAVAMACEYNQRDFTEQQLSDNRLVPGEAIAFSTTGCKDSISSEDGSITVEMTEEGLLVKDEVKNEQYLLNVFAENDAKYAKLENWGGVTRIGIFDSNDSLLWQDLGSSGNGEVFFVGNDGQLGLRRLECDPLFYPEPSILEFREQLTTVSGGCTSSLYSENGEYRLTLIQDAGLVLFKNGKQHATILSPDDGVNGITYGNIYSARVQNGLLEIRTNAEETLALAGREGARGTSLVLTNTGKVMLTQKRHLWAKKNSKIEIHEKFRTLEPGEILGLEDNQERYRTELEFSGDGTTLLRLTEEDGLTLSEIQGENIRLSWSTKGQLKLKEGAWAETAKVSPVGTIEIFDNYENEIWSSYRGSEESRNDRNIFVGHDLVLDKDGLNFKPYTEVLYD